MFSRSEDPHGSPISINATGRPTSSSSHYNRQTQQTYINNYNGPQSLPIYGWTPTSLPVPPVVRGHKRPNNSYSPYKFVKRQRINDHADESFPSFAPLPHQQAIPSTSRLTPSVPEILHPSPPLHHPSQVPSILNNPNNLQVYAKDKVSAQMVELFEACQQQTSDLFRKETYRTQLQKDIQHMYPNGRLYLTGSSMSGLGCRSSDADLCLVVQAKKKHSPLDVLSKLQKLFKSLPYVDRTQLIRAKVPILRFKEKGSNLEFDLNINNTVGIRNTFLLRSYTHADIRIRPIMLVIKKWARHCEINDASKGTLSSYTLALMVLHYLQTLKDPVLPSLQRDYPNCFDPFMDLDFVPGAAQHIPRYISKNKFSLGELFLGFLRYYTLNFRWDSQIISVREGRALPKSSSLEWKNKFICVEEPFERKNVARAVYEKAKFEAIKDKFAESYWTLQATNDLSSLLPLRAIIHKEQTVR